MSIGALIFMHMNRTDIEIIVSVITLSGCCPLKKSPHIFKQKWFVLIYLDGGCRVFRENDRNARYHTRTLYDTNHFVSNVYELGCLMRFQLEYFREYLQS